MRPRKSPGGFKAGAEGAIAVEFALILPLLVMLAVGTYEFGALTAMRASLSAAARAGAQHALISADPYDGTSDAANPVLAQARAIALSLAPPGTSDAEAAYFCQCVADDGAVAAEPNCVEPVCRPLPVQNLVSVRLSGTYRTLLPYPGFPREIPMAATAILRKR